jgi:uncharacterized membrane protein YkvA (DUF1232 family)
VSVSSLILLTFAAMALVWATGIAALVVTGRRTEAHAFGRFIPDCLVLFRRLLADEHISRRRKLVLVAVLGYLAMPFDLVPDFIPIAGQLDDVLVVVVGLRFVLRSAGADLVAQHWPGPEASLRSLQRLALSPASGTPADSGRAARARSTPGSR